MAATSAAPPGVSSAPAGGRGLKFLLLLAWKNLGRHRRRTVITAAALAASVAMFIFMDALLRGIDLESQRNLVRYETGAGRVVSSAQYRDLRRVELRHEIVDYRAVSAWLSERGVANTPRLTFTGELFFGEGSLPVRLVGIDPQTDPQVFALPESLLPGGEFLAPGVPGLLLGAWMSGDLGIAAGDFAALRENVLGSDFSYEDMTGAGSLLDDYEVVLEGNEPIAGRDCYRLRLTARRRDVVYPRQVVWIDAEQFVTRRVEQFSRRGRALKRMVVSDYRAVGDKLIAVRMEMSDLMKRDSRTVFLIDAIEVDGAVDETLFSLEELTF